MDKCESCPVPGGADCASARHARFCWLAEHRPEYLPVIVAASLGTPPPPDPAAGRAAKPRMTFGQLAALKRQRH